MHVTRAKGQIGNSVAFGLIPGLLTSRITISGTSLDNAKVISHGSVISRTFTIYSTVVGRRDTILQPVLTYCCWRPYRGELLVAGSYVQIARDIRAGASLFLLRSAEGLHGFMGENRYFLPASPAKREAPFGGFCSCCGLPLLLNSQS
jgi:hypothetical protein